ncbi:hypothetical protein CLV94_0520 [Flavobacterium endophyticum]|uniref:Uncharacterized protein n=1 Tax=Flavobacterium endophyticum TaxID=1540163 RepID=A0A495MHN7_9FLAO|nr:hypothetical protein [Flavobacterium endophyticum]RKS25486.1 hypothetical protein CLV94_0520 [Flavobacterium endophyticum]
MRKFISTIPPQEVTHNFTTAINAALVPLSGFRVYMTDSEKAGRSMAEDREGYVRLISRIANQFPDALSRSDAPDDLVTHLDYYDRLEANRLALLQALEVIQEISLGTATDIMTFADRYHANLKIARNHDASIDLAMREVDDWNARFGNRTPQEPENPEPTKEEKKPTKDGEPPLDSPPIE